MANRYLNDLTDIWNSAVTTFNAIKMNITDSASAADSKLIDLQVSSVSKFSVDKTGKMALATALPLASGGTGSTTPATARAALLTGPRPIVFNAVGGDETSPPGTVGEIRLAAAFNAVAPTAIITFECSVASRAGLNFLAFMKGSVRDANNGFVTISDTTEQVAAGGASQVIGMSRTLALSNLVVGVTYQPVLILRANVANTFTPQGLSINGFNG